MSLLHVPVNAAKVAVNAVSAAIGTPLSDSAISVGSNGSMGTAARKPCALGTQTLAQHLLKPHLPLSFVLKTCDAFAYEVITGSTK